MSLRGGLPRMSKDAKERVEECLRRGCVNCRQTEAVLTRRTNSAGIVSAQLQCNTCGRSISGSMKRADHYEFMDYAQFDEELGINYQGSYHDERRDLLEAQLAQLAFNRKQRSVDYAAQLRSSPEWRALRQKVLQRARFVCEACLSAPAEHAHHLTYHFGILPPAWMLRAVCKPCHERLHASKRGQDDEWCPGS
jgi:hypothetical protein